MHLQRQTSSPSESFPGDVPTGVTSTQVACLPGCVDVCMYVGIQLLHSRKAETQRTAPGLTQKRGSDVLGPAGPPEEHCFFRLHWPRRVEGGKWGEMTSRGVFSHRAHFFFLRPSRFFSFSAFLFPSDLWRGTTESRAGGGTTVSSGEVSRDNGAVRSARDSRRSSAT
jgi:hypothetical protein